MLQKQLEELQADEQEVVVEKPEPEVEVTDDELENFVFPEDM